MLDFYEPETQNEEKTSKKLVVFVKKLYQELCKGTQKRTFAYEILNNRPQTIEFFMKMWYDKTVINTRKYYKTVGRVYAGL